MNPGPRILLVDDNAQDRGLTSVVLSRDFPSAVIVEVADASAFALAIGRPVDLVITESELAWSDGLAILTTMKESHPEVPVVMFTHGRDEEAAVQAMKRGLSDYVVKSSKGYLRLAAAVREALERAEHDQQVARSEPWLQTLLERANIGVFRTTLDQRLIEANPALLRLLGVKTLEEALRMSLPTHFFPEADRAPLESETSPSGDPQARLVEVERPDGTTAWLNMTEVLLLDVDGEIVVDVLVQDLSHLKQSEQDTKLRLSELEQTNADLAGFASIASHELKAPLRAIARHGEVLEKDLGAQLEGEQRESLEFVLDGARRMQTLVDGLLEFSRLNVGWQGFEACDCNTLVDEAIRDLEPIIEETGARIERGGLPTVLGDPTKLGLVFQNLLSNALRFRAAGRRPRVEIRARRESEDWLCSVSDNGIGLDPGQSEAIFAIFGRLEPARAGTGIGLALCKRVVERHGGRIWVESKSGEGSKFSFTVAIKPREAEAPREPARPPSTSNRGELVGTTSDPRLRKAASCT